MAEVLVPADRDCDFASAEAGGASGRSGGESGEDGAGCREVLSSRRGVRCSNLSASRHWSMAGPVIW